MKIANLKESREHVLLDADNWDTPLRINEETYSGWPKNLNIVANYGLWGVTDKGSIIRIGRHQYQLWSGALEAYAYDDLILRLTRTKWFDFFEYQQFKRALWLACKIIGIPYPHQIRDYSERKTI